MPDFLSGQHLANIAGHAAVGCAMAAASGGKCGPGALAGGVGAFATPLVGKIFPDPKNNAGDLIGGTAATAVVGGVASVAGGGKFGNGAVTAGFGYMFNAALGAAIGRAGGRAAGTAACAKLGPLAIACGAVGGRIGAAIGSDVEDWLRGGTIVWNEGSTLEPGPYAGILQNRMTPDQQALKELVDEATNGARKPLSVGDAETILDWADETNYPGVRAGAGDVGRPSNWDAAGGQPHIHIPGIGTGHIPVNDGVKSRP